MGLPPGRTDVDGPGAPRVRRPAGPPLVSLVLLVAAAACYVGIVAARPGPPPGGDTTPLTSVTSALADGDLRVAASVESLPNPPGYPLWPPPSSPPSPRTVGAPTWCTTAGQGHRPPGAVGARQGRAGPGWSSAGRTRWRPSRPGTGPRACWAWRRGWCWRSGPWPCCGRPGPTRSAGRRGLLAFLAFLPAASSAIVQLYHPQDIVSLGLALAGLAQTLRSAVGLAGVLFGAAVLTKQFALLLLLPALVAAPDRRSRLDDGRGGDGGLRRRVGALPGRRPRGPPSRT